MKNLAISLPIAILSALPLVGGRTECCSEQKAERAECELVMTVGTNRLVRADYEALVGYFTRSAAATVLSEVGPTESDVSEQITAGVRQAFGRRVLGEYMEKRLLADFALKKGLKPDEEIRAGARKAVARYVRSSGEKNRKPLDDFADTCALAASGLREVMKDFDFKADDAIVSNVLANVAIYNERIAVTNALQAAAATNFWRTVSVLGVDFAAQAEAALKDQLEADGDYEPEEYDRDGLDELGEGIGAAVAALKAGEVAAPVCVPENGYFVLKLVSKRMEDDEPYYKVQCARFPMAMPVAYGSPQEIRARITFEKMEDFRKDAIRRLEREVGVRLFLKF